MTGGGETLHFSPILHLPHQHQCIAFVHLFHSLSPRQPPLTIQRPPVDQRRFRSAAVDDYIEAIYPRFKVSFDRFDLLIHDKHPSPPYLPTNLSIPLLILSTYLLHSLKILPIQSTYLHSPSFALITLPQQDEKIAVLFTNCFPNTLDTTIGQHNQTDTFVITGDIDAMWLR